MTRLPLTARLRTLLPQTPATLAFFAVTALETVADGVIVAVLLNAFEEKLWQTVLRRDEKSVLPVYMGLFILAHVFQLAFAIDALVAKNIIQIFGLLLFNSLFLVYSLVQIHEIHSLIEGDVLRVLVWFIPGLISLTEIVYLATLWPIWKEFGWSIFKKIGADLRVKRCYAWYQVLLVILKFDVFFFLAFSLQLVLLVPTQTAAERGLTIAALPVSVGILFLGWWAVKQEHRVLFFTFLAGCAVGCAYFVYKIFIVYRDRMEDYRLVFKSLTVFAALCLAALMWTTTTACICYRHFGRGLKYHMSKGSALASTSALELKDTAGDMDDAALARNRYRMSLD